jgi:hypothetical protein
MLLARKYSFYNTIIDCIAPISNIYEKECDKAMNQWEPPKVPVYRLSDPVTSLARAEVSGSEFVLVHQALLDSAGEAEPAIAADAPPTLLAQRRRLVEQEWLRLLNASLPDGTKTLTLETLCSPTQYYSYELYWLAHHYASNLYQQSHDYEKAFASKIIRSVEFIWSRLRPMTGVYQRLPARLRSLTIVPLEITKVGYRSVMARWDMSQALKHVAVQHENIYTQDVQQLIQVIFQAGPERFKHSKANFVELETENT